MNFNTKDITKIDIISSVFNCDQFLDGFFIDITQQTYFTHSKLILVAPNPSKKLKDLYCFYKEKFNNILLVELENDPGISKCLNIAIQNSNSPYITIANTDDRKRKDSLERHCLELDNNLNVDLVYGISFISYEPNEEFPYYSNHQIYPCDEFNGIKGLLLNNSPHNNPMWRRSMTDKNGLFDENIIHCADYDLWLRCVSNGSIFKKINEVLGLYYYNPNGMSTSSKYIQNALKEVYQIRNKYKI